jgi:ABC-type polysaccharide/polyol phosphate export permease
MFSIRQIAENYRLAWRDISESFRKYHLVSTMARQDIATRYKRSRIGAFWISIGMAISIGCIGLVFGQIFKIPVREFLPYFATGTILWAFISSCLNEGCGSFISSSGIILQVRMPLFVHVLRLLQKDSIIFAHNIVILPLVFFVFLYPVNARCLLAIPGFLLLVANLAWMVLILGTVCARFRDVTQIVQNAVGVLYFVTPIMWNPDLMPGRAGQLLLNYNPFYHLVTIVRAPLLGELPHVLNWTFAFILAVLGWSLVLQVFGRFRNRIAYWL